MAQTVKTQLKPVPNTTPKIINPLVGKPIVIVGHGRSGTNVLLEFFDLSAKTRCRNESDKLQHGLRAELPDMKTNLPALFRFQSVWDQWLSEVAKCVSVRDKVALVSKDYLTYPGQILLKQLRGKKFRAICALFAGNIDKDQFKLPDFVWKANQDFTVVLKINQAPRLTSWLLAEGNSTIVHIVRNPRGYLQSWKNRWLRTNDTATIHALNLERLSKVVLEKKWSFLADKVENMDALESEMWYWAYANLSILEAGKNNPNYFPVSYEHLCLDPLQTMKELFKNTNLEWTPEVAMRSSKILIEPGNKVISWKKQLTNDEISIINKIENHIAPLEELFKWKAS